MVVFFCSHHQNLMTQERKLLIGTYRSNNYHTLKLFTYQPTFTIMRHIYLTLLSFLLVFSSFAQSGKSSDRIDIHGFNKVFELEKLFNTIDIQGEIWQVHAMSSDGTYVFIVNDQEVPPIKSYRLSDGKFMGGLGSIGEGPGEFTIINRSGFSVRKDRLVVQGIKYMRTFKIVEKGDKLDFQLDKEIKVPGELGILNNGFMLNDYELAGSADFTAKEFVTMRLKGSEMSQSKDVGNFGDFPNYFPEIPNTAYHHLYMGNSNNSHDGKFLVKAYSRFPLIRIFDLRDGSFRDIELEPKNEQITKIVPDQRGMSIANGLEMFHYQERVKISEDFIVSYYQEESFKKVVSTGRGNLEAVPQTDPFLLVFNRAGELLAKLSPPDWYERFILTPDNKMIVFRPEIENKLFTVDLNQFK